MRSFILVRMEDDDLEKDLNPDEKLNAGKGNSQNYKEIVKKLSEIFENFVSDPIPFWM